MNSSINKKQKLFSPTRISVLGLPFKVLLVAAPILAMFTFIIILPIRKGWLQRPLLELRSTISAGFRNNSQSPGYRWYQSELTYSIENLPPSLSENEVREVVSLVFDTWGELGYFSFREVGINGDIRISWESGVHGDGQPFTEDAAGIAHAAPPFSSGLMSIDGDVHLNMEVTWCIVCDNAMEYNLHYVLLHEVGHALGLPHINEEGSAMWHTYHEVLELTPFDIQEFSNIYFNES